MIPKVLKVALPVIAIAALICAACAVVIVFTSDPVQESYGITYELNGGTNSENNPDKYYVDKTVEFSTPTRDGYIFDGWYKDKEMTVKITSTKGLTENLNLNAKWHVKNVYKITYELNGGLNSPNNPSTYLEDSSVMLDQAIKQYSVFYGWHYKSDFSDERVDYITRHQNSDVTLYAEWRVDLSGYTYNYSDSGSYKTPADWTSMEVTGTTTYSYLNYSYDKGYHMKHSEKTNIESGTTAFWSAERDKSDWTYLYDTVIVFDDDPKTCKVYSATLSNGETWTDYICSEDGIVYRMDRYIVTTDKYGDTTLDMTYTYTGKDYTPIQDKYTVTLYADEGIETSGAKTYNALSEAYLEATAGEDYEFKGWYEPDGSLADSSDTMHIESIMQDIVLYAYNTKEYDYEFDNMIRLVPAISLNNVEWEIYYKNELVDTVTSPELDITVTKAGDYLITYTGTYGEDNIYYGLYRVLSKGEITRTFEWTYNSVYCKMEISIDYNDYLHYKNIETERYRTYDVAYGKLTFNDAHTAQFVVVDEYIENIAKWFKAMKSLKAWSDLDTANSLLCFVQSIRYVPDSQSDGVSQYWRYPLETLFNQYGDDDDKTFLYCAVAKALGYQTAVLIFSDHMAGSVYVNDASGDAFTCMIGKKTYRYYYCETAESGWTVGTAPIGYTQDGEFYNKTLYGTVIGAVVPI